MVVGAWSDRLFSFMDATGCADLVTYNTLLKSFTATGQLGAAERVFALMEKEEKDEGGHAEADENAVYRGRLQGNRGVGSLRVVSGSERGGQAACHRGGLPPGLAGETGGRERSKRIAPDAVTYNLLVNAAVSAGQLDKAWGYIDRLKKANLAVSKHRTKDEEGWESFLVFLPQQPRVPCVLQACCFVSTPPKALSCRTHDGQVAMPSRGRKK